MFGIFKKKYKVKIKENEVLLFGNKPFKKNKDKFILKDVLRKEEYYEDGIMSKYPSNNVKYYLRNVNGIHYFGNFNYDDYIGVITKGIHYFLKEGEDIYIDLNKFIYKVNKKGEREKEPFCEEL